MGKAGRGKEKEGKISKIILVNPSFLEHRLTKMKIIFENICVPMYRANSMYWDR